MKNTTALNRITSIDALRAFALLGIIIIHASGFFCINKHGIETTGIDKWIGLFIHFFMSGKFATIFGVLFGVSFYLILKKPNYPSSKFVWRCFILLLIGLLNKAFYRPDVLMLYGFIGMFLVIFRNCKTNQLLILALTFIFGSFLASQVINDHNPFPLEYISDNTRYEQGHSFMDVIRCWPIHIMWYAEHTLHGGLFFNMGKFLLGYWIGKMGYIEIMDKKIDKRFVLLSLTMYVLLFTCNHFLKYFEFSFIPSFVISAFSKLNTLSGALFYAVLFIFIYNHTNAKKVLRYLEAYGKLGLTNYTMQGILLVLLFSDLGIGYRIDSVSIFILISIAFYIIQLIFSNVWLAFCNNGPLEYLWRCATDKKWLPLLKNSKV